MKRVAAFVAAALWMLAPLAAHAAKVAVPPVEDPSRLGYRRIASAGTGDGEPELILAQRTIDRSWGPSDDSIYVEVNIPNWKSEPLAASMSAVLPGSGQAYVGEKGNALVYAAIEVAGWSGWLWYRHDASQLRDQATTIAGDPNAASSGWTYERWASATGGDPASLAGLYAVDREAYLQVIGSDPRYAPGWIADSAHGDFLDKLSHSDTRLKNSRIVATGLWVNHLVSAATALRSARLHNLPLAHNLGMRIDPRIRGGHSGVTVTMMRRF